MAAKMATTCGQFAPVDTLNIYSLLASNINIWFTLSKRSPKFEHGFCLITKMDIFQRTITKMAARLSFCMCDHSNLVIYLTISSKFYIYGLLSPNYYSCLNINNNLDGRQNGNSLFGAGHYVGPFVGVLLF